MSLAAELEVSLRSDWRSFEYVVPDGYAGVGWRAWLIAPRRQWDTTVFLNRFAEAAADNEYGRRARQLGLLPRKGFVQADAPFLRSPLGVQGTGRSYMSGGVQQAAHMRCPRPAVGPRGEIPAQDCECGIAVVIELDQLADYLSHWPRRGYRIPFVVGRVRYRGTARGALSPIQDFRHLRVGNIELAGVLAVQEEDAPLAEDLAARYDTTVVVGGSGDAWFDDLRSLATYWSDGFERPDGPVTTVDQVLPGRELAATS